MTKKVNIDIVAKDKTKRAVGSAKKSLGGLKTFALAASAALATIGAGKIITNLVNVGKEIESLQIRFKLLFGSAEEGAKAFDTLTDFAGRVPFSLEDIAAASGNLAVVAKDAKELNRILEITGNVAGATGLDFQTTASQIQRAFSGGIASADIFREKGVRDMLGFSAGAKISVEETRAAFAKIFAGDGEFAKTTEALAGTLEGTLSMIGDKFFNFKRAINEAFFAELKVQFGDLNNALESNKEVWLGWGETIGEKTAATVATTIDTFKFLAAAVALTDRALANSGAVGEVLRLKLIMLMNPLAPLSGMFSDTSLSMNDMTEAMNSMLQPTEEIADGFALLQEVIDETAKAIAEKAEADKEAILLNAKMTASMIAFDEGLRQQKESLRAVKDEVQALTKAEDEWFSQRASASRQSVKDQKNRQSEIEAEKQAKLGLFNQAKKFAEEGSQRSKKLFKLNQALAIGEAIMNTYQGATKALAQGGIFGIITAGLVIATGMAQVANIRNQQPPAQFGGSRQQGTPFLVGERGPELFTPATAGTVTPNHQLGKGSTVVNFNINTVSAKGFNELLQGSRGMIVNMINTAVNERGRANLV
tara:strand:+ start:19109 stop:20884 length:1776 start_codon:yes stop_codon:yes gene_type:complete